MDAPLIAASGAALTAASRTAQSITDFLQDVPSARDELGPVLCEIFDVRKLVEHIQDLHVPPPLRDPVVWVARASADVLARTDSILSGCGDGPLRSGRWALTKAASDIHGLKRTLEMCRRTTQLALDAALLESSNQPRREKGVKLGDTNYGRDADRIVSVIDHLRIQVMIENLHVPRLNDLLDTCLHEIRNHVESVLENDSLSAHPEIPSKASGFPSIQRPPTPEPKHYQSSMKSVTESWNRMSMTSLVSRYAKSHSTVSSESQSISEASAGSPLSSTREEGIFGSAQTKMRRNNGDAAELKPPPEPNSDPALEMISRPSTAGHYNLFPSPPPLKCLPPIPPPKSPRRGLAQLSISPVQSRRRAISDSTHKSKVSSASLSSDRTSGGSSKRHLKSTPENYLHIDSQSDLQTHTPATIQIIPFNHLLRNDKTVKDHTQAVFSVDASPNSSVVTSRHGKHIIRLWDLETGTSQIFIKVPFYIQAQARSRDYFIRSHTVLSETLNLVAIATGFGHTLEIWNWAKHKKVQTIDDAYRWAAVRADMYEIGWCPLAAYREDNQVIDLYPVARGPSAKKPFGKPQTIDLRKAGLPFMPRLPELAYSSTGPLLVAAAGPKPPRPDCPPPEHAALLMAWQLDDNPSNSISHRPWKFLMPSCHTELEGALPLCLATYGSVAVSIWIPASFRTIGRPGMWQLEPVVVTSRYVLVWDFAANTTLTFPIPDVLSCVSPDCRFVAYCDTKRGCLVVMDAMSGRELWRWPGMDEEQSGLEGFEQLGDFGRVSELSFSADGGLLFIGDLEGGVSIYQVKEGTGAAFG